MGQEGDRARAVLEVERGHFRRVAADFEPLIRARGQVWIDEVRAPEDAYGGATSAQVLFRHTAAAQEVMRERRREMGARLVALQESLVSLQADLDAAQDEVDARMQSLATRGEDLS